MSLRNSIRRSSHGFHRAFIIAALLLFSANGWAGNVPVFGPKSYVRGTGAPVTVTDTFTVQNPSGQFTLHLSNGGLQDDTSEFVSSTVITVNGVEVVSPNDLNQHISTLDKAVQLQATNTISVQVRGKPGGQIAVQIFSASTDNVPPVITAQVSPAPNAAGWNNTNVTVTFTCTDNSSGVATCPAPVTVTTEGANQVVSGTATDKAGNSASTSVTLKIDKTPPSLTIASPANNSTVSTATVQLTGTASDALSGIASTTCNGTAAVLQSNAFNCSVTLVSGANSIPVVATDVAGNTTTQSLSITFTAGGQPAITDFNPKSVPVGTLITVTGNNLAPATGSSQVTLNQQGGGTIAAPVSNSSSNSLSFVIPSGAATGPITITAGNQSAVSVTSLSVVARSSFGLTAAPSTINVMQGKTGVYSVNLSSTSGFTQLASMNVTGIPAGVSAGFSPAQITAGQSSNLTISVPAGTATGNSTLTISASSTVDGIPSTQSATVALVVQPVTTSLFGRTVDSDTKETALGGITITMLGVDDAGNKTGCTGQTVSDAAGNFSFTNLPNACVGRQLVAYNGDTATDGEKYASVNLAYTLVAGQATGPEIVHLPEITDAETVMVKQNAPNDQTFTFKTMPGLSVTVYAGTIFTLPDGTQPDPFPFEGVQVPVDRLPDTPIDGPGALRAYIIAFQPADTTTNFPVPVTFPNTLNTPPGVNMELDTLDPVRGELVKYGTGTVSGDGASIVPDLDPANPGKRFGIQHFDWHGPMAPGPNGNNPGGGGNGPGEGGNVDLASGLEVARRTDIIIRGGLGGFHLTRTFRNLSGSPGPFGVGTSHNLGYQLNTFNFIQGQGVITLIMPDGNQFPFIRQANGAFTNVTIPLLQGAVLTNPSSGSYSLRWKNGAVFQFQAPASGPRVAFLSSTTDSNGNVTTLVRGNPNSPIQITSVNDASGRPVLFSYDNFDRITSITDPVGRTITYTYNNQGTLATVTDTNGGVTRYDYDSQNRLAQVTDQRGIVSFQNSYDANGRVVQQVHGDGGVTTFNYVLANPNVPNSPVLSTSVTDPLGHQTTYRFNAQGFTTDVTDPSGQVRTFDRDPGNNGLLAIHGAGVCEVCGDTLAGDVSYTRDANGNILTETDALGNTSTFTYDPIFNQVTSFTDPAGKKTLFTYDTHGNLSSMTDALGNVSRFTYNTQGQLIKTVDAAQKTTTFGYDAAGNLVSMTDPLGNTKTAVYDAVSRLVQQGDALGNFTTYGYDNQDHIISITDQRGRVTKFAYDATGDLTSVTDSNNNTTTITYNAMHQAIQRTDPLGRVQTYGFDLDGNLISTKDRRGQSSKFQYDVLNRPIQETYPDATVMRTYDVNGRLVSVGDSQSGKFLFSFDPAGRLLGSITPFGSISFMRDPVGRVISRAIQGHPTETFGFDAVGNLTSASMPQASVSMTYDARNQMLTLNRSNSVSTTFTYDDVGRLLTRIHKNGATVLNSQSYRYDAVGRRSLNTTDLAQPLATAAATATYNTGNQLAAYADHTYTYDENGNRLTDTNAAGQTNFVWDGRNRLKSITLPDGRTANLLYDFAGNLIQEHVTGNGTDSLQTFLLDDITNIAEEKDNAGNDFSILSGRGLDQIFGLVNSSGQAQFALTGNLGNIIATSGPGGLIDGKAFFEPFGQTTTAGPTFPMAFQGRFQVADNLYNFRNRYYDPISGRFISEDPAAFMGGANLYRFVLNDPLNRIDPEGLWAGLDDLIAAGGGAIAGLAGQGISDLVSGHLSGWEDYVGSAVGGAAAGETLLYTGNPILAGAAGGAVGNLTKQGLNNLTGRQCGFDPGSFAFDTGVGGLTGLIPGADVPGITSGRGSFKAVTNAMNTKLANGTVSSVSGATAGKMVTSGLVDGAFQTEAGGIASGAADAFDLFPKPKCK